MYGGILGLDLKYRTNPTMHRNYHRTPTVTHTSAQSLYSGVQGHILIPTVRSPLTVEDVRMIPVDFWWLITFFKV